jgi:hypothetical protein
MAKTDHSPEVLEVAQRIHNETRPWLPEPIPFRSWTDASQAHFTGLAKLWLENHE